MYGWMCVGVSVDGCGTVGLWVCVRVGTKARMVQTGAFGRGRKRERKSLQD